MKDAYNQKLNFSVACNKKNRKIGQNDPVMNEGTPVDPIRAKHRPEVSRLPNWNDESSLSAAKLHVPVDFTR